MTTGRIRSAIAVTSAVAVVAVGAVGAIVGGASSAGAASLAGVLRIHAAGSVYAGSNAVVAVPTAPSGVATYTLEVVNKGASLAQFNVQVFSPVTFTLASGSVFTTPLAASPDGYYTKPLAAGQAEVLTLKAQTPATAGRNDQFVGFVFLYATDGTFLDSVGWINTVKAIAGSSTNDIVTTAAGSAAVVAEPNGPSITTAEPIKTTAIATYTVKLQNDGPVPAQIHATLSRAGACPTPYPLTAKVGSLDVTAALLAGAFATPVLAHGKSTIVTIAVRSGNPAAGCTLEEDDVLADFGTNTETAAALITNLAAT